MKLELNGADVMLLWSLLNRERERLKSKLDHGHNDNDLECLEKVRLFLKRVEKL